MESPKGDIKWVKCMRDDMKNEEFLIKKLLALGEIT